MISFPGTSKNNISKTFTFTLNILKYSLKSTEIYAKKSPRVNMNNEGL